MSLSALIGAATPLVNRWVANKRNPTQPTTPLFIRYVQKLIFFISPGD